MRVPGRYRIGSRIVLAAAYLTAWATLGLAAERTFEADVPIRAITKGPRSHWFAYYDKLQFDKTGRYVLGMEVDFDDRPPRPDDAIRLGMVDLKDGDKWTEFATSRAWGWQQGCMLQWLPGSASEVIYNDRKGDKYVSIIRDVFTGKARTLSWPIYAVSPGGKVAVGLHFARVNDTRPGYGYVGIPDPNADDLHPKNDGIYLVDLTTGKHRLIISLDRIARLRPESSPKGYKHWFNHLLFSPNGERFILLHRGHPPDGSGIRFTRMFTARPDGTGLHCVADHGMVSHFIWRNARQILAWSREPPNRNRFHLYDDLTDTVRVIGEGVLTRDGHCSYSPDGRWIITDTYPDRQRMQRLMLYRPADGKLVRLGRFYLPPKQRGQIRCDLHPRWSRDGRHICIDSMHLGNQRQMYLLDVREIVR